MTTNSIIYISSVDTAVFDSQVINFLKEVYLTGSFKRVLLLAGVKSWNGNEKRLNDITGNGFEVLLFRQYPNYQFYHLAQKREMISVLKRVLTRNTIVHIRGTFFASIIKKSADTLSYSNIKIVTDIRGVPEDEMRLYLSHIYNPIKYKLKMLHYQACQKASLESSDYISCVSEALREKVLNESKIDTEKIGVNHCFAGKDFKYSYDKRVRCRKELGIEGKEILFVFLTGGNGLYENTKSIISDISNKGYRILNLSKEKIDGDKIITKYVPLSEIPYYLSAADIAIIWRNNDIVNNVASPVKFSEYVCCGLPVIANNGVHLINDFIKETGFGKTISSLSEIDGRLLQELLVLDRNKISTEGRKTFSSEVIIKNYLNVYHSLIDLKE